MSTTDQNKTLPKEKLLFNLDPHRIGKLGDRTVVHLSDSNSKLEQFKQFKQFETDKKLHERCSSLKKSKKQIIPKPSELKIDPLNNQRSYDDFISEANKCKKTLKDEAENKINHRADFEQFKSRLVGPNSDLKTFQKGMKDVPKEFKALAGQKINAFKKIIEEEILKPLLERIEERELAQKLGPAVDPTLPSPDEEVGTLHPLNLVRERITDIFKSIGFSVAEGFELDTEWYCFDALNTPEWHPARDEQDTLYMPPHCKVGNVGKHADERYILRTHTSTVQIRTMLSEKPPLRIIAPGRSFRRDTVDATHSANFHQVEGLWVDEAVSVKDLKATLDYFIHAFFGKEVETRLRPSFFPFTEPSFEMDIRLKDFGKLSNRWLEVMGCGMVDPNVFEAVGYDGTRWRGFAFGMGLERLAMLMYGVDDIRHFYQNDLRFLKQFA